MVTITKTAIKPRDVFYFRQRYKNRVHEELLDFIVAALKEHGLTRKDIADRLGRDPSQISRWLREPSNLTLESISDLLLALEAEPDPALSIAHFDDRSFPNYMHPLIARVTGAQPPVPAQIETPPQTGSDASLTKFQPA